MTGEEAKQRFGHGGWANALLFRVAEGLTQEQLEAKAAVHQAVREQGTSGPIEGGQTSTERHG
jgi:hypothetical protein